MGNKDEDGKKPGAMDDVEQCVPKESVEGEKVGSEETKSDSKDVETQAVKESKNDAETIVIVEKEIDAAETNLEHPSEKCDVDIALEEDLLISSDDSSDSDKFL